MLVELETYLGIGSETLGKQANRNLLATSDGENSNVQIGVKWVGLRMTEKREKSNEKKERNRE